MVTAYAQNFFEQSGVELEPSLAAILSGSFRLLSSLIAPLVLMRAPKKTLFVACGAVREAIEVVLRYVPVALVRVVNTHEHDNFTTKSCHQCHSIFSGERPAFNSIQII